MSGLILAVLVLVILSVILQVVAMLRSRSAGLEGLASTLDRVSQSLDRSEKAVRQELQQVRIDTKEDARMLRKEVQDTLLQIAGSSQKSVLDLGTLQSDQFSHFSSRLAEVGATVENRLDGIRKTLVENLTLVRSDNETKLEQMRVTVDEKLQGTLDRRLGESFQQVSDRLDQVHRGLGEMQVLTNGVGDLKKVLTNVKARGTWGEVQLGNLLQEVLSEQQYAKNVETRPGSGERVEFAVKLPGNGDGDEPVWLPIDSKFPVEDYQRLVEAAERGDADAVEVSAKALENAARSCAKTIHEKYVNPPGTTDFAIMFLPTEGLYAEVLRRPGLSESLQHDYRVMVTGPTTLCAFLNSLQMGFRTLAIAKRTSEVWKMLGTVKAEFGKFGDALDKVKKKLEAASKSIETAERRSRAITRQLTKVEELPSVDRAVLVGDGRVLLDPHLETEQNFALAETAAALN
jgi:DNA recombination protein RmuC